VLARSAWWQERRGCLLVRPGGRSAVWRPRAFPNKDSTIVATSLLLGTDMARSSRRSCFGGQTWHDRRDDPVFFGKGKSTIVATSLFFWKRKKHDRRVATTLFCGKRKKHDHRRDEPVLWEKEKARSSRRACFEGKGKSTIVASRRACFEGKEKVRSSSRRACSVGKEKARSSRRACFDGKGKRHDHRHSTIVMFCGGAIIGSASAPAVCWYRRSGMVTLGRRSSPVIKQLASK
jgi:hypothetical protein